MKKFVFPIVVVLIFLLSGKSAVAQHFNQTPISDALDAIHSLYRVEISIEAPINGLTTSANITGSKDAQEAANRVLTSAGLRGLVTNGVLHITGNGHAAPPPAQMMSTEAPRTYARMAKPEDTDPFWICINAHAGDPNQYEFCNQEERMLRSNPGWTRAYGYPTGYPVVPTIGYYPGSSYGYSGYLIGISDKQKLRIPEYCLQAPADRICTEGKIKFDTQELLGTVRALIQKAGLAVDTKVIAIAVPLDSQDQPVGGMDEKGPVTAANNFFNHPVHMTKGRYKLAFRLQGQYFSTFITVRSEYENNLDDQKISVSADRFQSDPMIGKIIQQKGNTVAASDYVRGKM